ncbi:PAC2 family-domain-containing protein [Syncephalis plumigaleata]|nr:PAC2 family-domain-containing protein [Syncephalis plumigaleata]
MSNTFVPVSGYQSNFANSWLIIPAVSTGGVPQLATDLLVTTWRLNRVGHLNDPNVLPIACVDPCAIGQTGITTALEVLQSDDGQVTVIQQRSPELPGRRQALVDNLLKFAQDNQFKGILLLSSLDMIYRPDMQLPGKEFRYVVVHGDKAPLSALIDRATTIHVKPLESILHEDDAAIAEQIIALDVVPMMHGSGITRRLLVTAHQLSLPVMALCLYTVEGDNTQGALSMTDKLVQLLSIPGLTADKQDASTMAWKIPTTWQLVNRQNYTQELFY